jgi:hypothetical protein
LATDDRRSPGIYQIAYAAFVLKSKQPLMSTKQAKGIVPPEPHSTGPDFREVWNYMPRWLQIIVLLAFFVVGILVAIFMKGQLL